MMDWLARNADFLGGAAGLIASVVLAIPLIPDLRDRKHWDRLRRVKEKPNLSAEDRATLEQIRDDFLDHRLGNYHVSRRITFGGLVALMLAFGFLMFDAATPNSGMRRHAPPEHATTAP